MCVSGGTSRLSTQGCQWFVELGAELGFVEGVEVRETICARAREKAVTTAHGNEFGRYLSTGLR